MPMSFSTRRPIAALMLCLAASLCIPAGDARAGTTLLNVSYDPTREFYVAYNAAFAAYWKKQGGEDVTVQQSHGGSGKQARAVIDGLEADVVTLGIPTDVDAIANAGLIAKDWVKHLPQDSTPYTSTIVFLVRKGNPKAVKDWGDLVRAGISVIAPNPKTSSGGQMAYLAAYGWALDQFSADAGKAKDYIAKLYKNVPVLDSGARGSTVTFTQRGVGDVLLAWENEAFLAKQEAGRRRVRDRRSAGKRAGAAVGRSGGRCCRPRRPPQDRRGLSQLSLQRRRAGYRGQVVLPPALRSGRGALCVAISGTQAVYGP